MFLALVGYFVWNVTQGDRGLEAYAQRQDLLHQAQADLVRAKERDAWEHRVAGLRNQHIDRDTLDERARAMLNIADPTDIIVPYGPKDGCSERPSGNVSCESSPAGTQTN